jgi:hypothetical protein
MPIPSQAARAQFLFIPEHPLSWEIGSGKSRAGKKKGRIRIRSRPFHWVHAVTPLSICNNVLETHPCVSGTEIVCIEGRSTLQ